MLSRDEHDGIVRRLYEAAAGDANWRDVLAAVADRFGHSAGVVAVQDPASGGFRAWAHGQDDAFANTYYASEVFRADPRAAIHMAVRPGDIYHDHALYDVKTMLRDTRVRNSIEMIGVAHQMGLVLRLPSGAAGWFTLLSTEAEGTPQDEAVQAFRRLAPHIEQACALGEIVERAATCQATLLEALATRADGVILLDAAGCPAFMNDGAQAVLAAGDGLAWHAGSLLTARAAETRRLHEAIRTALAAREEAGAGMPGAQMAVTRPSGRRPYVVRILPAPRLERFLSRFGFACVVHIHDLGAVRVPDRGMLAAAFGLTGRETDLAIALVRCSGLTAAATEAGMAHNTARNHLQAVFRRCGVASQAEAVALFSRLG
ncbi:MAG: helix-turn-helix transcriptional regulator [Rhodospirillaceae bacterium]